jgi:hypothetical protein
MLGRERDLGKALCEILDQLAPEMMPIVTPGTFDSFSIRSAVASSSLASCGVAANGSSVPSRSTAATIDPAEARCCHSTCIPAR